MPKEKKDTPEKEQHRQRLVNMCHKQYMEFVRLINKAER